MAGVAGAAWVVGTAELAWARIAPGPRTRDEVLTMLWTSAALPPAAVAHRLRGTLRARRLARRAGRDARCGRCPVPARPAAVLLDRDDTLVHDVPYNGDPELVLARPGVRRGLDRLRAAGIPLASSRTRAGSPAGCSRRRRSVRSRTASSSSSARSTTSAGARTLPRTRCACRKPRPGMLLDAAAALGVDPVLCAMVGDIGADVEAARAAGMRGLLVPTDRTLPDEVAAAAEVAADLRGGGRAPPRRRARRRRRPGSAPAAVAERVAA